MQITLNLEGTPKPQDIANMLRKHADAFWSVDGSAEPATSPKKVKKAEETFDFANEEEETKVTTREDVVAALNVYAKKYTTEKAIGLLKKFKVKSVKDLSAKDYSAILELAQA